MCIRDRQAPEYYLLPMDECYKLVGLIRTHWKGLSGGTEVWQQIGEFFKNLKMRSEELVDASPVETGDEIASDGDFHA